MIIVEKHDFCVKLPLITYKMKLNKFFQKYMCEILKTNVMCTYCI